MNLSNETKGLILIVLLLLIAGVLLCSGCFPGQNTTSQLSGAAVDRHVNQGSKTVGMAVRSGGVRPGQAQYSNEVIRVRSGSVSGSISNGHDVNDSDDLAESNGSSVCDSGSALCPGNVVHAGRVDSKKTGRLDESSGKPFSWGPVIIIVGWVVYCCLVWRNYYDYWKGARNVY